MSPRIPTPIPEYWVESWRAYWRASLVDVLWRTFLVVAGGLVIYAGLQSAGVLVGLVVSTAAGIILSDDISQTIRDLWNRNFWVWKP